MELLTILLQSNFVYSRKGCSFQKEPLGRLYTVQEPLPIHVEVRREDPRKAFARSM